MVELSSITYIINLAVEYLKTGREEELSDFIYKYDENTKWYIAKGCNVPKILDILSRDTSSTVKYRVSLNRATSIETLEKLSDGIVDELYMLGLLQNPNTSSTIITKLYNRGVNIDRHHLFTHPNCPMWLLVKFYSEVQREDEKRTIERNPNFPSDFASWALSEDEW
jgi:hypothetical protein